MKALITGMTPTQCGRQARGITVAGDGWRSALEHAGWEVDHRVIAVNEDLGEYDAVLVGIGQINSMTARHASSALYALLDRPDAKLFCDDWQITQAHSGFRVARWSPMRLYTMDGRPGNTLLYRDHQDAVMKVLKEFAKPRWKRPMLVATHGDGVPYKLKVPGPVTCADPSNFTPRWAPYPWPRERAWIWASLYRYEKSKNRKTPWAGTWPIVHHGRVRDLPNGVDLDNDKEFIPQDELIEKMQRTVGYVVPERPLMGSGWWRHRYVLASDSGNVVVCHPDEAAIFGDAYLVTPQEVEAHPEPHALWQAQRDALNAVVWSADRCAEVVDEFMRS